MPLFVVIEVDRRGSGTHIYGPFYDRVAAFAFTCNESLHRAEQFMQVSTYEAAPDDWHVGVICGQELIAEWMVREMTAPPKRERKIKVEDLRNSTPRHEVPHT